MIGANLRVVTACLFSVQRSDFLRSAIGCAVSEKLVSGSARRHYPIVERAPTQFVRLNPHLVQILVGSCCVA
jgi:hypothetical protein